MRMSIISYGATGDAATAKAEYDALGEFGADTLAAVKSSPGNIDPNLITQYEAAVSRHCSSYRRKRLHRVLLQQQPQLQEAGPT